MGTAYADVCDRIRGLSVAGPPGPTELLDACASGDADKARAALAAGADPNAAACSPYMASPLYVACAAGQAAIVRILLAHPGIDVEQGMACVRDGFAPTPLFKAVESGRRVIVEYLLQAGADVRRTMTMRGRAYDVLQMSQAFACLRAIDANRFAAVVGDSADPEGVLAAVLAAA